MIIYSYYKYLYNTVISVLELSYNFPLQIKWDIFFTIFLVKEENIFSHKKCINLTNNMKKQKIPH